MVTSGSTFDFCADLDVPDNLCYTYDTNVSPIGDTISMRRPKTCLNRDIVAGVLEKAGDPDSFLSRNGPQRFFAKYLYPLDLPPEDMNNFKEQFYDIVISQQPIERGGYLMPRTDDITLAKFLDETEGYYGFGHLVHAAGMVPTNKSSAYPWCESAWLTQMATDGGFRDFETLQNILKQDLGIDIQRYYGYLNPFGMKKWRSYYWGENYEKLAKIRGKYDPPDIIFDKPLTIESKP